MTRSFRTELHAVYNRVAALEPLGRESTPGESEEQLILLTRVNQYVGQMSAHIRGLAEASVGVIEDVDGVVHDGSGEWCQLCCSGGFCKY